MARPKDRNKEERLLRTALKLIHESGFDAWTMADLAKRSELATGTTYTYFKTKTELTGTLWIFSTKMALAQLELPEPENDPFIVKLRRTWEAYLNFFNQNIELISFIDIYCNMSPGKEAVTDFNLSFYQEMINVIEEGKQQMLIKNMEAPLLLAQMFSPVKDLLRNGLECDDRVKEDLFQMSWDAVRR